MANHAALIRAENPGLAVVARGRNSIHFDMGNGQRRAVLTIDPLHVRNSETEIDVSWIADTGAWQYKLASADFQVNARNVLNAGNVVQWLDPISGESVTVQPLALNWVNNANDSRQQIAIPGAVTATANDCTLTWPNGYGQGIDFRYTAHPKRLIKHIVINSAAALPAPTVANPYLEIEFVITPSKGVTMLVDGAAWDQRTKHATANAIEFRVTATGQTAWLFEAPSATDSSPQPNPNSTPGIFELSKQGANLWCTLRIPKAWVDSAVFPIYLDPTLTLQPDAAAGKDCHLQSGLSANANFGITDPLYCQFYPAGGVYHPLLQFDLSSIPPAATIVSAILTLVVNSRGSTPTINIYRMTRDWVEGTKNGGAGADGATWNKYDGTNAWTAAGGDYDDATAYASQTFSSTVNYVQDIATLVQGWVNGTWTNNGFLVRDSTDSGGSNRYIGFYSSDNGTAGNRPKLVVEYSAGGVAVPVFMHHYSQLRGL